MVVKKTNARKAGKKSVYKVSAVYNARFNDAVSARTANAKIKQNPKAQVAPVKKVGSGYGFAVKFAFVTPSAAVKKQAVDGAKKAGAKVSVSTVKM